MLSRLRVETTPSVLWCYKTEPSVTAGCKKRSRQLKKAASRGVLHGNGNEPLELFVAQANLRWCYYRDTVQIMGSTFSVVVLQDFEALTPNLLARTVETVEGGGFIVILIQSIASLTQLYSMSMDVHKKFNAATALKNHEWRHWASVTPRFNERFVLSFADCDRCVVMDDEWNILPLSRNWAQSHSDQGNMLPPMNAELSAMVASACVSPWTRRIVRSQLVIELHRIGLFATFGIGLLPRSPEPERAIRLGPCFRPLRSFVKDILDLPAS